MAYDIPDEIKYREKIVANLDSRQLITAIGFGVLALFLYKLPIQGELKFVLPGLALLFGVGFVFLNLGETLKDIFNFYLGFRKGNYKEEKTQRFFEAKSVCDAVIHLDNEKVLAVLEVQSVNFRLMDEGRKISLISNYKEFLNQLTCPIQILVRTTPVSLEDYFESVDIRTIKDKFLLELYADFKVFEEEFLLSQNIKERRYYLIIPFMQIKTQLGEKQESSLKILDDLVEITQEKLASCGLESKRLIDSELSELLSSYGHSTESEEQRKNSWLDSVSSILNNLVTQIEIISSKMPGYLWKVDLSKTKIIFPNLHYENSNLFSAYAVTHTLTRYSGLTPPSGFYFDKEMSFNITYSNSEILGKSKIKFYGSTNEANLSIKKIDFSDPQDFVKQPKVYLPTEETKENRKITFREKITPSFDIRKNYVYVNEEIHKIVKVIGYPRKVEDGWLSKFLSKNENYDISLHITPTSINDRLVYLHNQIIQQTGDLLMSTSKGTPNPALEIKKNDTVNVYDSIYKGEEKMFSVSVYLDSHSPNLSELNLLTEKCNSNLNAQLMIPKIIQWRLSDGIKSVLPIGTDKINQGRDFLTNSLAATFPFISSSNTKRKGILFAHEAEAKTPIFIDFDSMNNKHFFVVGLSGSGKSYTSKYILMQQLLRQDMKAFILDPNGEYRSLCNNLGGQVIELSRDSKIIINIFDLAGEEYGDKMLSLISAFDIIVGGLTENQKGVLNRTFSKAYSKKGIVFDQPETWNKSMPVFSDIRNALFEVRKELADKKEFLFDPSVEVLVNRIELYCKGGLFGFLDQQSKIDLQKNLVCFDLSKLHQSVKNLLMFATLEQIKREISKDQTPKLVLIDEGWSLLRGKEASAYILDFIKTSRKFNTSIGFITQEIEDLLASKTGKSILNTASIKILMRQNPSNINLIVDTLQLNPICKDYLLTAKNGYGLLITEQSSYKFCVSASDKLNRLITTKPMSLKQENANSGNVSLDLEKGLYLKKNLNENEENFLLQNGYQPIKARITRGGGAAWYLVKVRSTEAAEHAFLCWMTFELAKKRFQEVKMNVNKPGDVVVDTGKLKIAFEIETGHNLKQYDDEYLRNKFQGLYEDVDEYYIIVSDYDLQKRYERYGNVILRNGIEEVLEKIGGQN